MTTQPQPPTQPPMLSPRVQRMHPLRAGKPFPTLYWLTDAPLDRAVAGLERLGWITRFEQRIAEDPAFRQVVHEDHKRYALERWSMLTLEEQADCAAQGYVEALRDRGVGGTANPDRVKCLHAHVAHALSSHNTLGNAVLAMLETQRASKEV